MRISLQVCLRLQTLSPWQCSTAANAQRTLTSLVDASSACAFIGLKCVHADNAGEPRGRCYAMKGPRTILSATLTSNSLWQLMQDMYWLPFWATPGRTETWMFCLTLQCGHSSHE